MNEEDPSKNDCTKVSGRVVTIFLQLSVYGDFPDAQGQLTHKSLVGSCRVSNPSKMLWLSSLPARIKKNQSKMNKQEWSQGLPHYNPMGAICCHGNQISELIWPKPNAANPLPQ